MFPVGLVSGSPVSTPIVQDGQFSGFYVGWDGNRKFPLDMAGFAFSVRYYREVDLIPEPEVTLTTDMIDFVPVVGYQESVYALYQRLRGGWFH